MRKNALFYFIVLTLLVLTLLFFNRAYRELTIYSGLTKQQNTVYNNFQKLSRQISDAAVLTPNLIKASNSPGLNTIFFTDSQSIVQQLELLKVTVRDSVNIVIAGKLDTLIRSELSWLLISSLPDSIINQKSAGHITSFQQIRSLINQGIQRTTFLIEYQENELSEETSKMKVWMAIFILLSGIILIYTTINLFKQQSKRKGKERELEIVLNRITEGVVSVDNDWRYTFLNNAAMATHPLSKEETIGKVIWDIHPEMKGTVFWDKYHEAMLTKKTVAIENYYPPMDIWFSVKVYPFEGGLTIFYRDITERKKAELEIRQLNTDLDQKILERTDELLQAKNQLSQTLERVTFLATITDNIQDPVIATDNNTVITKWNKGAEKLLEWKSEEVIGKNSTVILKGLYQQLTAEDILRTLKKDHSWEGEAIYKNKSGWPVTVLCSASDLKDAKDNVIGYLFLLRDITDRIKAEDALSKLNEELELRVKDRTEQIVKNQREIIALNHDLEQKIIIRTEQLKKSNDDLEAFSYSVSHDLRAPLRGIIGFAKILQEEYGSKLDDEAKRVTAIIMGSTLKMGNLIDDLLAFSRMGKQGITKILVNSKLVVNEIVAELLEQNKQPNTVSWDIHDLLPVNADMKMLRQVWINLISNALKYSRNKEQPHIEIGSYAAEGQAVFYIKDNGAGFDEAYKAKLFKVFQRLHDADEFEGTGVGLALVDKIISRQDGKVWAEGKENVGASFYFSLPINK